MSARWFGYRSKSELREGGTVLENELGDRKSLDPLTCVLHLHCPRVALRCPWRQRLHRDPATAARRLRGLCCSRCATRLFCLASAVRGPRGVDSNGEVRRQQDNVKSYVAKLCMDGWVEYIHTDQIHACRNVVLSLSILVRASVADLPQGRRLGPIPCPATLPSRQYLHIMAGFSSLFPIVATWDSGFGIS